MLEKLALPEIRELIEANDLATLGDVLNGWLPADLGGLIARVESGTSRSSSWAP